MKLQLFVGDDVDKMAISEDSNFVGVSIQDYQPEIDYILSSGYGEKTIYVYFYTKTYGIKSELLSDSIIYTGSKEEEIEEINPENNIYLFKYPDSPKVYLLENGGKRWIISEEVFNQKGYKWNDIQTIDISISYPDGKDIVYLFKYPSSPKVYLLENNQKRWIINEYTFNQKNYDWNDIQTIDESIIYLNGKDINEQVLGIRIENNNYVFKSFLNIGSVGEEVKQLQTKLKKLGYFTYQYITGYFGPITKQAIKDFQKANSIEPVGCVGPQTREALNTN